MLKLLIAEDEALERKALKFLLDKYFFDSIEVVDEVTNGRDAVDKALLDKPDIILMDIHMPIMDGLEASSIIRNSLDQTEFIILTAFNYFDYAKKAIQIGASDYLLKPFSNGEFVSSLTIVINKINSKNSIVNKDNQLKRIYEKIFPYIEKQMIANIAYGVTLTGNQFNEYRAIFSIDSVKFCCILFNLQEKKTFNENSISLIKNKLGILFPKIIGGLCLNDIILFVFDESTTSKISSRAFDNLLNNLRQDFKINYDATLSIGVGTNCEGLDQLYLSYKEAKRRSVSNQINQSKFRISKSQVIENNNTNSNINDNMDGINHILSGKIINEDLSGAIIELDAKLSGLLKKNQNADLLTIKKVLLDIFDNIIEDINEFIGKDFKSFSKDKLLEELINLREISDLNNCISMILKNFTNYISSYKKSKNIDVVEKVKDYIENNYMNDVSLDNLAQYVSMSSFYLSRIFSKVEDINIKEYIIKIRMEKAKSMIREGNRTIKQIAWEVGYSDQNYFSRAFKKYNSVSPKEYGNL